MQNGPRVGPIGLSTFTIILVYENKISTSRSKNFAYFCFQIISVLVMCLISASMPVPVIITSASINLARQAEMYYRQEQYDDGESDSYMNNSDVSVILQNLVRESVFSFFCRETFVRLLFQ